ncbi:hypothetical protein BLNAU_14020 [Blattamonas nauphoetae]|uniref:Serine-threonine/tyrosine-protein kinase catalytic domain-containing protein n=1 Tax=Blattamonas nauphoetae TaxID=2049346 RepID=A0ABQ9XHY8_9EUKA|nr:hypothetical protein BLNAU_14020 [Blattamonas nauphoetae]
MLPAVFMESATNTLIITETVVSSERQVFGGMCHFKDMDSQSSSASVTISASSLQDHRITSCDSFILRFDRPIAKQALSSISSTISAVSFNNITSAPSNTLHTNLKLSQVMHGCSVTQTNNHLSGSTIRDFNSGGSLFCQNTSFTNIHTANTEPVTPEIDDPDNYKFVGTDLTPPLDAKTLVGVGPIAFAGCTFKDISSTDQNGNAGAITATNIQTWFLIDSCTFTDISSSGSAGAVLAAGSDSSTPTIVVRNSNFTRGLASTLSGGGLKVKLAGPTVLNNTKFEECQAETEGGGCLVSNASSLEMNQVTFDRCLSRKNGAGLHASLTLVTVTSSKFIECRPKTVIPSDSSSEDIVDPVSSHNDDSSDTEEPDLEPEPEPTPEPNAVIGSGACFSTLTSLSIELCVFETCHTAFDGGGFLAHTVSGLVLLHNCTFVGCSAGHHGGAARIHSPQSVSITEVLVDGCQAALNGAGIHMYLVENDVLVRNCTFTNCIAKGDAGAIKLSTATNITLDNVLVTDCKGMQTSGGIFVLGITPGETVVKNCTFNKCITSNRAGGLSATHSSHVSIAQTFFTLCETNNVGGGLCVINDTTFLIENCTFDTCKANSTGGGLHYHEVDDGTLKDLIIKKCEAKHNGGGILGTTSTAIQIESCVIEDCTSLVYGGGIKVEKTNIITLSNIQIRRCSAQQNGGGIHLQTVSQSFEFNHSLVEDCVATNNSGGAVFAEIPLVTITNNTFRNCSTKTSITGGLRVVSLDTLTMTDCRFFGCKSASSGGGLSIYGSSVLTLDGITAQGCSAKTDAGGLLIQTNFISTADKMTISGLVMGGEEEGQANSCRGNGVDAYIAMSNSQTPSVYLAQLQLFAPNTPQNGISFNQTERKAIEYGMGDPEKYQGSILYVFHPYTSGALALDSTLGEDHALCGNTTLPCSTLPQSNTLASSKSDGEVSLRTNVAIDADLTVSNSVAWTSESTKRTITQTGDCSISVSAGILTASTLSFAVSASSYSKSFFVVNGGSLALSTCSFDSITSTSPIIHATLTATNRLSITKTTDTDITTLNSCSSSSSALIHLSLSSPNNEVAWTFDLTGLSFSSAQSNSESAGQRIFVSGSNFSTQIVPTRFPSVTESDEYLLWGMDSSTEVNCSLLVYLIPIGSTVSVGGTPTANIVECGHFGVSCPTLQSSFNRVSSLGSDLTISVNGTFVHSTRFQVQTSISLSIQSNTSTQTITTTSAGCLEVTNGALTIKDLAFTGTSRADSFISVSNLGQLSIDSCTLSGFQSTSANGVAIQATLTSSGSSLTLDTVTFQSCSSARGGALFLHLGEGSLVFITVPTFTSCTASNEGKHIYATAPSTDTGYSKLSILEDAILQSPQNKISFTESERSQIEFGTEAAGTVTHVGSVLYHFYRCTEQNIMLDTSNGADHTLCGHSTLPCESLSFSYQNAPTAHTILVRSPSTLSSLVMTEDKTITITSSTNVAQKLTVSGTGGFDIQSGSLHFNLLSITIPSAYPNPFASVSTNGHLTLEACSVKSVILTDSPFISHVGGDLNLTNCQFSSITRHTGNGSVLFSDMQVAHSLNINGLNLSSVATKNGKVDGLHIIFPRSETPSSAPTFTLKNIRYDHPATTSNVETSFVWIVGEYFSRWVETNDTRFKGSFESSGIKNEWLWAEDTADDLSVSMLFHLKEKKGAVGVEKEGKDSEICGYFSLWCRTLSKSLERMQTMKESQINVMGTVDLDLILTLEDTVYLHGKESPAQLAVTADGHLECTGNELFRFDYLTFSLPANLLSPSVLSVQDGQLLIQLSSLVSASKFEKVFIAVHHGLAELTHVTVLANIEGDGKMIVSDQGNVTLKSLSFPSSLKTFGTIAQTTGGDLSIDTAVFASLSFTATPFILSSTATTFSKVNVSSCTIDEFITASLGSVSFHTCMFEGSPSPANSEEDLCEWVSGIFNLTDCSADTRQSDFSSFPQGVFNIKNGKLVLINTDFIDNHAGSTTFPSVQRNIHCEGSAQIHFTQPSTNVATSSHWISTTECVVKEGTDTIDAPFFIPTLDTNKTKSTSSSSQYTLSIVGTLLVPCQLFLEVFENTATKSTDVTVGSIAPVQLTENNTKNWTEQSTTVTVPVSLLSTLNQSFELRARLSVGSYTTDSIRVKLSRHDERKAQAKKAMSWIIPIVASVTALLLFLLILILLIRRHQKKKQAQNVQTKELGEMDTPIEVKYDEPDMFLESTTNNLIRTEEAKDLLRSDPSSDDHDPTQKYSNEDENYAKGGIVKAFRCGEETMPEVTVFGRETLYNRLHHPTQKEHSLDKTTLKKKLTRSLAMVANTHPSSPVLSKLTSHWVMFDVDGEICLRLAEPVADRPVQTLSHPNQQSTNRNQGVCTDEDGQRWVPPEMANGQQIIDVTHGTVFRLGLILWEIETEQIPFGEVDGINAQRQLGIGVLPKMDKVDEEMKELITKCLQVDPLKRPALSVLAAHFNPPKDEAKDAGECFKEPSPDLEYQPH